MIVMLPMITMSQNFFFVALKGLQLNIVPIDLFAQKMILKKTKREKFSSLNLELIHNHTQFFFFFFRISFTGKETVSQIGILSRMSTKKRQQKPKYGTIYSDEWMQNVCEMQLERRQKKK